jgi:hypothetical protein
MDDPEVVKRYLEEMFNKKLKFKNHQFKELLTLTENQKIIDILVFFKKSIENILK